jgi:cytochrome b subunit of formate dehydrogenase
VSTISAEKEGAPNQASRGPATLIRILPAIILAAAVVGAIVVVPMVNHDQGGRDWYRGLVGGSGLYRIDTIFARLLPFVAGAAISVALLERGRRRTHVVAAGETLRRHEVSEVLAHWLNAAGIGLCLITAMWLRRWFDRPFSLDTTYIIHFVGSGMIVAAVTHHIAYQRAGGGTGLIPRRLADAKNALAELVGYTGVYRGMPGVFGIQLPVVVRRPAQRVLRRLKLVPDPNGKYLATEKVLSYTVWTLLLGVVVITGVVKTLNYLVSMPGGLLHWSSYLHDGATIFLIVFLGIHVAALVLVPRNWPLLKSMFTTRISRAYAKEHLPLWTDEESGG